MRSLLPLFLITWTIFQIHAFTVNTTVLKCETDVASKAFSRGDTAIICLHFLNDVQNLRMAYQVVVDEYSALTVTGAQATFLGNTYKNYSTGIAMQASTTNSTSTGIYFIKQITQNNTNTTDNTTYLTITSTTVYTVFSAVIQIENGIVQTVIWDNSCYMCTTSECDSNYYATDSTVSANCFDASCAGTVGNATCDPKVYISWIGTDANGLKMESAGLRISNFRQYSISDLYASAKILIDAQYNTSSGTYDCSIDNSCSQSSTTSDTSNSTNTTTTTTTTTSTTTTTTTTTP
jgi:hypothetical protein